MKIASRFPVKESKGLHLLIVFLHLSVFLLGVMLLGLSIQLLIVVSGLLISFHFSNLQLKAITESPDDLCWSGEQWLVTMLNDKNRLNYRETIYLEPLSSSWITSDFSLLKFRLESADSMIKGSSNKNNHEFAWFFSASNLGDRLYRELCFLIKQSLREQSKLDG